MDDLIDFDMLGRAVEQIAEDEAKGLTHYLDDTGVPRLSGPDGDMSWPDYRRLRRLFS